MFGFEEKKKGFDVTGFIGKGVVIEGRLSFEDTVRIDGTFKGVISAAGTLVVGDGGYVEGDLTVGAAIITGDVKGTLEASDRVELRSPGRMLGDIKTPNLIIGEGVIFEGSCIMLKKNPNALPETVPYGSEAEKKAENQ